jgi:GT2 family glycosyltransferase
MALISVIIPAYNRAHLLGETLRSILNQTVTADEVIMVDDGSTDDTAKAAETAFAEWESRKVKGQRSPEFKVIRQENKGPAAARNAGFTASKGEFIHFFDSDDLAATNKHEVQLKALEKSGADIAYGPWVKGNIRDGTFTPEDNVLQQHGLPTGRNGKNADLIKALLTNWSIVPHACLFRRSIVQKAGGFPEHLFVGEDQLMFLNCLLAGAKVIYSPGTLELYRTGGFSKLTAVGEGQRGHVLNWARFLIDADQACQKSGITARHWFGFRARAWQTIQDLEGFCIHNENLKLGLEEITGVWMPRVLYRTHRAIERKWLGLKMRTAGHRTLSPFRSGPITKDQNDLIERLLFNQKNASVHSFDSP